MKKAQRQPPASMSTAPRDGPVATARAEMPPHMATAWARSDGAVAASRSASEAGMSSAAPTACTTRPPMSIQGLVATPHSREPSVNTAMPRRNQRRRPERSAMRPAPSSRAPNTTL